MDSVNLLALQQTRAATFFSQMALAISQVTAVFDDDDDDDDEEGVVVVKRRRRDNKSILQEEEQQRHRWDRFVIEHQNTALLRRHLKMTYDSFQTLLELIRPHLPTIKVDEEMDAAVRGGAGGGAIIPELQLYATIRYLSGASYSDICFFCCISTTSSLYRLYGRPSGQSTFLLK